MANHIHNPRVLLPAWTSYTDKTQSPPKPTVGPGLGLALHRRSLSAAAVPSYSYLGCFSDASSRILNGSSATVARNNPNFCCEWCRNANTDYLYCGVEAGYHCYCDSTTGSAPSEPTTLEASSCNSQCPGAGDDTCGGAWALGLYRADDVVTSATALESVGTQLITGYSYLGCYTDSTSRVLALTSTFFPWNSPQFCCEWCANIDPSNKYCGVEAGDGCFCDTTTTSASLALTSDCSHTCSGATAYGCGGAWRVGIYSATAQESATTSSSSSSSSLLSSSTQSTDVPTQTSNVSPPTPTHKTSNAFSGGAIAGISIGALVAVCVVVIWFWRRFLARRGRRSTNDSNQGSNTAFVLKTLPLMAIQTHTVPELQA